MIQSGRVPEKGRIRAIIRKFVQTSTKKWKNKGQYWKMIESKRVPEKVESIRLPKNYPNQYRKIVESVSVPEYDRIQASTGKR